MKNVCTPYKQLPYTTVKKFFLLIFFCKILFKIFYWGTIWGFSIYLFLKRPCLFSENFIIFFYRLAHIWTVKTKTANLSVSVKKKKVLSFSYLSFHCFLRFLFFRSSLSKVLLYLPNMWKNMCWLMTVHEI